jgi:hypothetical protein
MLIQGFLEEEAGIRRFFASSFERNRKAIGESVFVCKGERQEAIYSGKLAFENIHR